MTLDPTCLGTVFIDQVLGGTYTGTIASYNIKFGPPPSVTSGVGPCGEAGNNRFPPDPFGGWPLATPQTHLVGGSEHEIYGSIY